MEQPLDRREFQSKKTNLFIILSGIFLTNAILAEIIGVKIFSGEYTLGLNPAGWTIFGQQNRPHNNLWWDHVGTLFYRKTWILTFLMDNN